MGKCISGCVSLGAGNWVQIQVCMWHKRIAEGRSQDSPLLGVAVCAGVLAPSLSSSCALLQLHSESVVSPLGSLRRSLLFFFSEKSEVTFNGQKSEVTFYGLAKASEPPLDATEPSSSRVWKELVWGMWLLT